MSSIVESADIKVLKGYPEDKVWNVSISFPEILEGLEKTAKVTAPVEYSLYQIQGWTDEPVDLNELRLAVFNTETSEYKLSKGDDANVPERVQSEMLNTARDIMFDTTEFLSRK